MLFSQAQIQQIHAASISAGVERHSLLAGIDPQLSGAARTAASPAAQLLADLDYLNQIERAEDGSVPLMIWLSNAVLLVGPRRERSVFQGALNDLKQRGFNESAGSAPQQGGAGAVTAFGSFSSAAAPSHFLDSGPPLDFGRPETQELLEILFENIWDSKEIHGLLRAAGVTTSSINLNQAPKRLWHDVLERARAQGTLRKLLQVIISDPGYAAIGTQLGLLLGPNPPVAAVLDKKSPLARGGWKGESPGAPGPVGRGGHEKKTGHDDTLLDIAFLDHGLECAKSVVRLLIYHGSSASHATGFIIDPEVVLTNYHALFRDGRPADEVQVWFGYELDRNHAQKQHQIVHCRKDGAAIRGDARYDWAIAKLETPASASPLSLTHGRSVKEGDRVCIIQHPNGLPKKIGLVHNEVKFVSRDVIQYLTDTEEGSSGSPVFNERWDVVALHHMWIEYQPHEARDRVRNQGIRIERVVEALRERGLLPGTVT